MSSCASGYNECPKPTSLPAPFTSVPDSFCCKQGTTCKWLAENTTVVCCPDGYDCDPIAPIVCDLSLQNSAVNPEASIKTMLLVGELLDCGSNCCPWGYGCNSDSICLTNVTNASEAAALALALSTTAALISSQSLETGTPSTKTTVTTSPSAITSIAGTKSTALNSAMSTSNADPTGVSGRLPSQNTEEPQAVVAAAILGGILGVLLMTAAFIFIRRRQTKESNGNRHRASQKVFMKAELDNDGELRPRSTIHMLSAEMDPVELPATPLQNLKSLFRYSRRNSIYTTKGQAL